MRPRWASPKSRSNEATGYLVDLIYAPFIVIVEEKKKKKKESWALASARVTRRCSNSGTQPSTLPSVHAINAPDRDNVHARACRAVPHTYMRIGRAGMPFVAALAYHRAPTCFAAAIARTTTRVHPRSKITRVETLKWRKAMKGPFDDHVWQLKHTYGTPFLMLVTMVTMPQMLCARADRASQPGTSQDWTNINA